MIDLSTSGPATFTGNSFLTLWGTYLHFEDYIHETYAWLANSTKQQHKFRILRIIETAIPNHDSTAICQYPADFPDIVYREMARRGKEGSGMPYEAGTLMQFRYLMQVILDTAKAHYLWHPDGVIANTSRNTIALDHSTPIVRRFLRPDEEVAILKNIIPQLPYVGEARLLLIQIATGLRENECCGLNWSMICRDPHSGICTVMVMQTVRADSNKTKLGGKSNNAPRIIVIPDNVYALLMAAKKQLYNQWVAGGNAPEEFENLPCGCRGNQMKTRAITENMTAFANELFSKIGIRKGDLATLAASLITEYYDYQAYGLYADINDYRSPTCYLLRRSCATHLIALQYSESERQYHMGHQIEDPTVDKRIFTTDAIQQSLHKKALQRPLLNPIKLTENVLEAGRPTINHCNEEVIIVPAGNQSILLSVKADEPGDPIEIIIEHNADPNDGYTLITRETPWPSDPTVYPYPHSVNVLSYYHALYAPAAKDYYQWQEEYSQKNQASDYI